MISRLTLINNNQMDDSRKRTLTEEGREIALTTDRSALATGAAPELAISLRNVAARIRHSVSQGYRTPPSNNFVKAQSTGTIFRSMNDTLLQAHTDLSTTSTQHLDSSKKRSHSAESDDFDDEQGELQIPLASRPTRPLRISKSMFGRVPSLPGLPTVAESNSHHIITETKEVVEEEDWSLTMSSKADEQFEVMEF